MGKIDTESKQYVNYPVIFADLFNYFLFDGETVIKPEKLKPADTTAYAVPYGNNAKSPVQRYRDSFKVWSAMTDGKCTYVLLGCEIQNKVHYAMPVKNNLYDALGYASEVDASNSSYHNKKKDAEISIDEDTIKIKLTQEEFLSGFRKEDKLIPIVTLVIYFGSDEWDGPLSLHEMLACDDERILKAIPDYKINLVAPCNIPDDDFDKFKTGLGLVLNALKYAKGNVIDVIRNARRKFIDRQSAEFLKDVTGLPLTYSPEDLNEKGDVNMSNATQKYIEKEKVLAAIAAYQQINMPEKDIIANILKAYPTYTEQDVIDLLHPAA